MMTIDKRRIQTKGENRNTHAGKPSGVGFEDACSFYLKRTYIILNYYTYYILYINIYYYNNFEDYQFLDAREKKT